MGAIFGKQTVAEPAYEVLFNKHSSAISYEIRRYGQRFAAEVSYPVKASEPTASSNEQQGEGDSVRNGNPDRTPFMTLARYIGVIGTPENEGNQPISMTAPVMKGHDGPVKIAMTAPVVKQESSSSAAGSGTATMAFVLPAEFDALEKIPKPTNPAVHIQSIPPAVGVVYRYSGTFSDDLSREKAEALCEQLQKDGLEQSLTTEYALDHFQFWGYNPPFTIPMFRRNEIWLELTEDQVKQLMDNFGNVDVSKAN